MNKTEFLKMSLEKLTAASNYIDTLGGVSKGYRMDIERLKAALEAKDEPVAWIKRSAKGNIYDLLSEPDDGYEPVYTTPPQRKPLTDEEIKSLDYSGTRIEFARAIEAAHGIKGQA